MMKLACLLFASLPLAVLSSQEGSEQAARTDSSLAELSEAFAAGGLRVDFDAGALALQVTVEVPNDLLEYLLVGSGGASHESLFRTQVQPSLLNTALLALGVEAGTNAQWRATEPPPTEEELAAGAEVYEVDLPAGDGFFLYAAWRENDEVYWFRVEDLMQNLSTGRSMQRHRWVYLGSRLVPDPRKPEVEAFAADLFQNLINVSFFGEGYTLVTGAVRECLEQTIWVANAWLVPPRGTTVDLIFARERLTSLPAAWAEALPQFDRTAPQGERR